jgi:hypothetical protein
MLLHRSALARPLPLALTLAPLRRRLSTATSAPTTVAPLLYRGLTPTYHYQRSLPRLPIPPLAATLQRYVRAVTPLAASPHELDATRRAVDDFAADAVVAGETRCVVRGGVDARDRR